MKRYKWRSIALGVMLLALAGCQQPFAGDLPVALRSRARVKTALSVLPARDPNAVKSLYAGSDAAVSNWNLLLFENGVLKAKYYKDSGGDIAFDVVTDRPYQYYAIANVGDISSLVSEGVTTERDLAALAIDVSVNQGLPMAWKSAGELSFSRRQLAQGEKLSVSFTRLVGSYDIVVDAAGLSAWSFRATSLQLKGASRVTPFTARSRAASTVVKTDEATAADLSVLNGGGAARFYPVENCFGNLLPAGTDPWNKIPTNLGTGAFPSYIEIQGKARMTDGSELERDVTYRFYLGNNASNNFDVVRNETHTVTLVLSDASLAANSTHWKVTTGSYADTRALAFTHESLLLPYGGTLEEPVIRTPASLKYTIEIDPALVAAGVTVAGYHWGDPCTADRITLSAPAGGTLVTGEIRLKTLDGLKRATATLTVGKELRSLRIGLWPSASEERFHSDTTAVLTTAGVSFWAHVYACYSDGSMTDVTSSASYSCDASAFSCGHPAEPGKFSSKRKPGRYVIVATFTEDGVTCTAEATITLVHGALSALHVYPDGRQTFYTGGKEYTFTLKAVYEATDGELEINPDDAVWTIADNDALEYAGAGKLRTKYKRTSTYVRIDYTETGVTRQARIDADIVSNLIGLTITPSSVYLLNGEAEAYAPAGYSGYVGTGTPHYFTLRAYYDDGTDEDVTYGNTEWTGNKPMYYVGEDTYFHVVDAYPMGSVSAQGKEVQLFRFYSKQMNFAGVRCSPNPRSGSEWLVVMSDIKAYVTPTSPKELLSASYTHNGVTLSASVMGTLVNQARPQRVAITPNPHEAYAGGREARFEATCYYDDGTSEDIRTKATWSADGLVTSQGAGLFTTGATPGTTKVHASYTANGVTVTGDAILTVKPPVITSCSLQLQKEDEWTTGTQEVNLGSSQTWRLLVVYENGETGYVYDGFTLSSSAPAVVAASGVSSRAVAVGQATVTARYQDKTSDGVTLSVSDHHYSYDLRVEPNRVTLESNGSRYFYAYYRRLDNGMLDTSFGTNGRIDVSSEARWEVDASLLAVATWNDSQRLSASNTTDSDVSGKITATYEGLQGTATVLIRKPFVPALSASPELLTWAWEDAGSGAAQTLSIRSNTDWQIRGAGSHWSLSATSGTGDASVTIYPVAPNESAREQSCTLTLSAAGVSDVTVTLKHSKCPVTPPETRYKVVTSVASRSIRVGGSTTASAVLLASEDGGATWPTTVSQTASGFSDMASSSPVSISGATVKGVSVGEASIRGQFDGYSPDAFEDAPLSVTASAQHHLSVSPGSLSWAWDAAGAGSAATVTVSSDTDWQVKSVSGGFSYGVSGTTIQVWPDAANDRFGQEKTGTLVVSGTGVSDVSVRLSQGGRQSRLSAISFDRSEYELVRIESGALTLSQSFRVLGSYDDGSTADLTALASYEDQGAISVDRTSGVLRATDACSGKTLKASYSGLTATASYTAEALECPLSLSYGHMESQGDKAYCFLVEDILLAYEKAFVSGTQERDVTADVACHPSELIVCEGYQAGTGQMFHFTAAGEGTLTLSYTLNGISVSCELQLKCSTTGKITKR